MNLRSTVSVIIPTKDRKDSLLSTLRALVGQTKLPEQIVIVDQSATSCEEECRQVIAQRSVLVYIYDPNISGVAVAKNTAIKSAGADVWVFIDDDEIPEPDYIEVLLGTLEQHAHAAAAGGVVTNYSPPAFAFRAWCAVFKRGPFYDDRQPVYWRAAHAIGAPVTVSRLGGGLMAVRADAAAEIRFDERLIGSSLAEDVDFSVRLPGSLLINPAARLFHVPRSRAASDWVRLEAQSAAYLYNRHWRRGLFHRLCYQWLLLGLSAVVLLRSIRKRSSGSWASFITGVRAGQDIAVRTTGLKPTK